MRLCLLCGAAFPSSDWRAFDTHVVESHGVKRRGKIKKRLPTPDYAQLALMLDVADGEGYVQKM